MISLLVFCDLVPSKILRQGLDIRVNDEPFRWDNLGETLRDALTKARIFGAAFIYVGVDDGQAQETPLLIQKVRGVRFLNLLTSKELSHASFYGDPNTPQYGHVGTYRLNTSSAIIHESRLISFFAIPPLNYRQYPPSILQRVYPVLQQFHTAWQSTAHLMTDAAQGIFKLKNLHVSMGTNRSDELLKRMELVDTSRSISRLIWQRGFCR